jgi:hypothetical protein
MELTVEQMRGFLQKLYEARFSGVREVNFEGRRVAYSSDAEFAAAIGDLERRIRQIERPRSRIARPYAVKDL